MKASWPPPFLTQLPAPGWLRTYQPRTMLADLSAAVVVVAMLAPQCMAYAMLAGLPPQLGLYASIAPLLVYALIGSSATLSVGPVAITSLLAAQVLTPIAPQGTARYIEAAAVLAVMSGLIMFVLALFRGGALSNLLSHPVVIGFTLASGLVVVVTQLPLLFGLQLEGGTLMALAENFIRNPSRVHLPTALTGCALILALFASPAAVQLVSRMTGLREGTAQLLARTTPVMLCAAAIAATQFLGLRALGVRTVSDVTRGGGGIGLSIPDLGLVLPLLPGSVLVALIGFASSIAVARALSLKTGERIDANRELLAIGVANIASGVSGAFPVSGGLARSAVNLRAGARTPAAGAFVAVGMAAATLAFGEVLGDLPLVFLAAVVIVSTVGALHSSEPWRILRYSRRDFAALSATFAVTALTDTATGLATGVVISIALLLHRLSAPNLTEITLPGGEDAKQTLALRIDESLTFANAAWLEETVMDRTTKRPDVSNLILLCSGVHAIDSSGLAALEALDARLVAQGVKLRLADLRPPLFERLARWGASVSLGTPILTTEVADSYPLGPRHRSVILGLTGGDGI